MAQLDIEPRKRNAWPWIIAGIIAIAALAWFLLGRGDRGASEGAGPGSLANPPGSASSAIRSAAGDLAAITWSVRRCDISSAA
jgi:hypothetical protein